MFDASVFPVIKAFQLVYKTHFLVLCPLISVITGGNLSHPLKDSVTEVSAYELHSPSVSQLHFYPAFRTQ